jgi:lambda repressor-like predicted transcriptional regulator
VTAAVDPQLTRRLAEAGDQPDPLFHVKPSCTLRRCTSTQYALDLCERHYNKQRRIRNARGDGDKIPTLPVRTHVRLLRRRGWTWQQIAAAGRTSVMMLHRVLRGEQPTMRRDKVIRILAIEPVWRRTQVPVPMLGIRRRLDALAWQGWSNRAVARQVGLSEWTIPNTYRHQRITAEVAARIADFYEAHAHQPGPDPAYAKKSRTLGALPAWVWDDDGSIDDPGKRPAGARRERRSIA